MAKHRLLALATWALVSGPCELCLPGGSCRAEQQFQTALPAWAPVLPAPPTGLPLAPPASWGSDRNPRFLCPLISICQQTISRSCCLHFVQNSHFSPPSSPPSWSPNSQVVPVNTCVRLCSSSTHDLFMAPASLRVKARILSVAHKALWELPLLLTIFMSSRSPPHSLCSGH